MPRPQTLAVKNRNAVIYAKVQAGKSLRQVGEDHGLSHTQVANIVAAFQGDLTDETERGVHSAMLDALITELMTDVMDMEPDPKVSATGKLIEINGQPVMDNMTFMSTKATVAKAIQGLMESKRKMLATDIPKKLPMAASEARTEMDQFLATVDARAKAAKELDQKLAEARALGIVIDGETE